MDTKKMWVDMIVELQSLAQAGLTYGKDAYDKERYVRTPGQNYTLTVGSPTP